MRHSIWKLSQFDGVPLEVSVEVLLLLFPVGQCLDPTETDPTGLVVLGGVLPLHFHVARARRRRLLLALL